MIYIEFTIVWCVISNLRDFGLIVVIQYPWQGVFLQLIDVLYENSVWLFIFGWLHFFQVLLGGGQGKWISGRVFTILVSYFLELLFSV